jgi:hypothetical protein
VTVPELLIRVRPDGNVLVIADWTAEDDAVMTAAFDSRPEVFGAVAALVESSGEQAA